MSCFTVFEHLLDLYKRDTFILMGMYMGSDETRWNILDIMDRKKGFASELERHCTLREPIYLKVSMLPLFLLWKRFLIEHLKQNNCPTFSVPVNDTYNSVF